MYDQLCNLDTSKTSWRIKARLTRMWPSVSSTTSDANNALKGYNLILLDDDDCHVQAFVYAENWRAITPEMEEGSLYIISNFYTREAKGTLRPTSNKIIINFSNSTTVVKLDHDDFMIPRHKFEFVDLSDLFRIASGYENSENPELSIDIIGVVEDFENVKLIPTMFGEKHIVKFRITDGRYNHKVTVWGQLAVAADDLHKKIKDRPIIGIVTSTKLKVFKSSVQINTLPSSKIYLNLEDDCVYAMKLRIEEEGYKTPEVDYTTPVKAVEIPVIPNLTVKELAEKTNTEDLERIFQCFVKIAAVEEAINWWYYSCTGQKCLEEVYKIEGRYKCPKCGKNQPVAEKRYKFVVLAGDTSEAFNFVLLDRAAKRILGQTATKMIVDNGKNEGEVSYPEKIKQLAGKEFSFSVQISSDNVLLNSKIFTVIDAHDDNAGTSSQSNATIAGYTISSFSENMIDLSNCGETPESAKSVTKKIKMEK